MYPFLQAHDVWLRMNCDADGLTAEQFLKSSLQVRNQQSGRQPGSLARLHASVSDSFPPLSQPAILIDDLQIIDVLALMTSSFCGSDLRGMLLPGAVEGNSVHR